MSLKAFHIIFIIVSTLFCAGFGVWALRAYQAGAGNSHLLLSIASFLGTVTLIWYGLWFLKKLKGVSYL